MPFIESLNPVVTFIIGLLVNIVVVWGAVWFMKRDLERYANSAHESNDSASSDIDGGADTTSVVDDGEYISDYDFYHHPYGNRDD